MLNPQDFRIDTFNTGTSWFPRFSGVSVTHLPTGTTIKSDTERSQFANKTKAYEKLLELLKDSNKQMELF